MGRGSIAAVRSGWRLHTLRGGVTHALTRVAFRHDLQRSSTQSRVASFTLWFVVGEDRSEHRSLRAANAVDYELLAQRLATRLAEAFGSTTETCQHNVVIRGRATNNQIDVLWVGTINGARQRIVIECKNYGRALDQGRIHAFVNVVRDISTDDIPTVGVVVTPVGYQRGAKAVAGAYDLLVLELREPSESDLVNRIVRLDIAIEMRMLGFEQMEFVWVERFPDTHAPPSLLELAMLTPVSGGAPIAAQELLALELGPSQAEQFELAEQRPRCEVTLPEPHVIDVYGESLGQVISVSGTARVSTLRESFTVGPGREGIAHVLVNALDGTTAWFTLDGEVRVLRGAEDEED